MRASDILFLQELWLLENGIKRLQTVFPNHKVHFKSGVENTVLINLRSTLWWLCNYYAKVS